ncbi:hypothetical protein M569_01003, partial [Genlisea aurea]
MSAVVCGKRSSIFEDSPSSPPVSKRTRCSSSSSPGRSFSPPRATASPSYSYSNSVVDHLVWLFPGMDRQLLEKTFEESGNNLDSTIKRLNELHLTAIVGSSALLHEAADDQSSAKGENVGGTSETGEPSRNSLPADGAEWVELLLREVLSAPNVQDAKTRLSRSLEALEKSISTNATAEAAKTFHKENRMLKEQLEAILHENAILKRAVAIQHERQKEFENVGQELHQLKQLVAQYQDQVRTLEV